MTDVHSKAKRIKARVHLCSPTFPNLKRKASFKETDEQKMCFFQLCRQREKACVRLTLLLMTFVVRWDNASEACELEEAIYLELGALCFPFISYSRAGNVGKFAADAPSPVDPCKGHGESEEEAIASTNSFTQENCLPESACAREDRFRSSDFVPSCAHIWVHSVENHFGFVFWLNLFLLFLQKNINQFCDVPGILGLTYKRTCTVWI